jgi:inorganic pyrophosphatase
VLILMDEPAFPGCVVTVRLIGALKAEQSEDRKTLRNDRLVAVAEEAHDWRHVRTLSDLDDHLLNELEQFFVSYNRTRGKKFKLLGTCGPKGAVKLLDKAKAKPKAR